MKTIDEVLTENRKRREQGDWFPACGGSEKPFAARSGRTLLYCYQPRTGNHAYLDCFTDIILTPEEAEAHLQNFSAAYPKISDWMKGKTK